MSRICALWIHCYDGFTLQILAISETLSVFHDILDFDTSAKVHTLTVPF